MILSSKAWFRWRSLRRFLCLTMLSCIVVLIQNAPMSGQNLSVLSSNGVDTLPPEGVSRYGSIETTVVRSPFDGEDLFQVAAPTVTDRSNLKPNDLPVEVRANSVEALLRIEFERFGKNVFERIVNQISPRNANWTAPRSAEVIVSTLNNRPVIQIRSSDRSRPFTIITVTQTDVDFYSETADVLSEEWRTILQNEIDQYEQLSSREWTQRGLRRAIAILIGIIIITVVLGGLHWLMGRKCRSLAQERDAAASEKTARDNSAVQQNVPSTHSQLHGHSDHQIQDSDTTLLQKSDPRSIHQGLIAERARFMRLLQRESTQEQQLKLLKSFQWALLWLMVFVWYCGLIGLTYTLPMITSWRNTLLSEPFRILLIGFVVNLALRLNRTLTHRYISAGQRELSTHSSSTAQRRSLRINTVGSALEGFVSVLILLTGLLFILSTFGLSTRSILAWSAVLGLAISFGVQNLIKDVVNGCLILLEDQFAIGDVVIINDRVGLVEEMSLRSTRLRNPEGQLITIPNSNISEARNLTRLWSRVDFTIEVAYDNDPDKVLALLTRVAQEMYTSPEWGDKMPEPPEVLGIDRLSHSGMLIRVWLITAPLQQWLVGREYRLRVRKVFEVHGITIGKPQWISHNATFGQLAASPGIMEVKSNLG